LEEVALPELLLAVLVAPAAWLTVNVLSPMLRLPLLPVPVEFLSTL
jgi:hypothetical protein